MLRQGPRSKAEEAVSNIPKWDLLLGTALRLRINNNIILKTEPIIQASLTILEKIDRSTLLMFVNIRLIIKSSLEIPRILISPQQLTSNT